MTSAENSKRLEDRTVNAHPHSLELETVDLVGGGRVVEFWPGFNIIQGDITTGKTTLVRLIRAMLGTMPSGLAPEVSYIRAIRGRVKLGGRSWYIYRPRTTTADTSVEVAEENPTSGNEGVSLRLHVGGSGLSYSTFLLDQLGIPAVSVPTARTQPTGNLSPVTMTDWLGYCIVTGDELDTQVFGHQRHFRDLKRRWVFELAYGYYEPELASLNAKLRGIELQLATLERDAAVMEKFLAETPFAVTGELNSQLVAREGELKDIIAKRRNLSAESTAIPGVHNIRKQLLATRVQHAEITDQIGRIESQISDLSDLHRQLSSQSARLTRAIVADEWLVDYDFVVCPRCGNDVDAGRTDPHTCYLCQQQLRPAPSRAELLSEQERVTSQVDETSDVITARRTAHDKLRQQAVYLDGLIGRYASELDELTDAFVSDHAEQIEYYAAEQARLESEIKRLHEYQELIVRHQQQLQNREDLEAQHEEVSAEIQSRELSQVDAEANVQALEQRLLEYLHALNIPDLGQELSVKINRNTYLPEVSGRTFDELSSQGLKTLVNIGYSLAHHTVAIDRNLPLPGLLILDGLSANAGHEGFDQARIRDVYRLLGSAASQYEGSLQVIAVDNMLAPDILKEFIDKVKLLLTQQDRLIRIPADSTSESTG
jgi:hypothetical protein